MRTTRTTFAITVILGLACGGDDQSAPATTGDAGPQSRAAAPATALASDLAEPDSAALEAGRLDASWRRYAEADRTGSPRDARPPDDTASAPGGGAPDTAQESWDEITPRTVNGPVSGLPIHGDVAGPSVARVQILLDLASFSPGVIDGRWGKNTEKAVYWFQRANGLDPTGRVDRTTLDRLTSLAGGSAPVQARTLTEQDVGGPFVDLPDDVYERADLECLCYGSLREKLGETFHSAPALLEQLNPGVDLGGVQAGDELQVPAVDPFRLEALPEGRYTGGGEVARVVISDGGHYVHALDQAGDILYHFPSTLGADYAPSPDGTFSVESITFEPTWHYQPELLTGVDPDRPDAVLPPGPNNAVGIVWMQLSREHYGIHGTSAPETIGYATSNGCVRLTNWDAGRLGRSIPPGTPVEFRDVTGRTAD